VLSVLSFLVDASPGLQINFANVTFGTIKILISKTGEDLSQTTKLLFSNSRAWSNQQSFIENNIHIIFF